MKEEIRIIPWTNGQYGVSNLGKVYSYLNRRREKLKEPRLVKEKIIKGYHCVYLYIGLKRVKYRVNRLVAMLFIPNPDNLPVVNHKDECKDNNCADNLEWCTTEYNNNYGTHNRKVSSALRKRPFAQFDGEGNIIKKFETHRDAANHFKIAPSAVCRMLNERSKNKYNIHYI